MRLRINDLVKFDNQKRSVYRLQKISGSKLTMAPHAEANVDMRNRDQSTIPFAYLLTSASSLQRLGAKKLHVSPTGLVSEAK